MYRLTIYYTAGYFMTIETSTGKFLWVDIMKLLHITILQYTRNRRSTT